MTQGLGILEFSLGILEFPRAEILGSSPRMTKKVKLVDDTRQVGMTQGLGIVEFHKKNHLSHFCEQFCRFSLITDIMPAMLNSQCPWTLTHSKSFCFFSSSFLLGRTFIVVSSSS